MRLVGRTYFKRGMSVVLPDFGFIPSPYDGPSKEEVIEQKNKYVNPAIYCLYQDPIMLVEGNMQYLYDETGKRYLDMLAGIVSVPVGHSHPRIVEAMKEQFEKLQHTTTIYLNPNISEYAEALTSKLPDHLDTVIFTNSGSEATDLAILLSRLHTKNFELIGLRHSYHGMSNGAMGLTSLHSWKFPVPHGFGIQKASCPHKYRGVWSHLPSEQDQAEKYSDDVLEVIDFCTDGSIAGFICEPVQGVAGVVEFPDGYLSKVYDHVRSRGGVCISDEVQTAFGRLGRDYWGFEYAGVEPDIVTMAKGICNGFPGGAVVTTKEIGENLSKGLFFNTFGGNPVSMKLAKTVIEIIDEENLQKNSEERGTQLQKGLKELQEKYELIGDVRGSGLMVGLELVKDRDTKEPALEETTFIQERAKDLGLLLGKGSIYGNVFRMTPPLCISEEDIQFVIDVFDDCFEKL